MKYALAVDTSTTRGSISLLQIEEQSFSILKEITWDKESSHSETLTHFCQKLLTEQNISLKNLHLLAVGLGPGSFTGLRVGINFIRTLSFTLNLPVVAINSLHLLAQEFFVDTLDKTIVCINNAQRNMVFYSSYENQNGQLVEIDTPQLKEITQLESLITKPVFCLGNGFEIYQNLISSELKSQLILPNPSLQSPKSSSLGSFCQKSDCLLKTIPWSDVKPLYIRPSTAEEMLRSGFLKPAEQITIK